VLTEADGGPLAVVVAGANVHDAKLLEDTIAAVVVERPRPDEVPEQHLCLDKGYDNPTGRAAASSGGHVPHIRPIGEEKPKRDKRRRHKPRRWVVERTIGWLNRCRGILVRYEKKAANYLGVLQLACALLWYRRLHRLTT
jgi:putative transposase